MAWYNLHRFEANSKPNGLDVEKVIEVNDLDEIEADIAKSVEKNILDKMILKNGDIPAVNEIYKARWVWYHTILAIEIFCTNILLIAILLVLAFK
jgi:hypothetical protein